jgi:hypothetical protein
MDRFSLIVVSDETSPVRRFEIRKSSVRRGLWVAGVATLLGIIGAVDYVRVRVENLELDNLREETTARRTQVAEFQAKLEGVDHKLSQLQEFERKIRIIANLPGSAASGGADSTSSLTAHDVHWFTCVLVVPYPPFARTLLFGLAQTAIVGCAPS